MLQFSRYGLYLLILLSVSHDSEANKANNEEKIRAVLDLAEESITTARDLYSECEDEVIVSNRSGDGERESSLKYLEITRSKILEAKNFFPICDDKPVDCSEVMANGNTQSGLYFIWPRSRLTNGQSLLVYCDMDTDGGGWTVIQRRGNFSTQQNFHEDWEQYKIGFGDKEKDFWLGNDNIHALTNQAVNEVRIDLQDVDGGRGFAHYSTFWIDNEDSSYTLHIGNYSGNVGDGMKHHNNMKFSTKDRGDTKYARFYKGGWWFYNWAHCHLNGRYKPGQNSVEGIHWWYWRQNRGLVGVEIKIRSR